MKPVTHVTTLILFLLTLSAAFSVAFSVALPVALSAAQEPAAAAPPTVTLAPAQMAEFLQRARIVGTRGVSTGITNTRRATLSDGVVTHDAQIQIVDQAVARFQPRQGPPQFNFRDSFLYNVAAYRVATMLGLDNVPMSVERSVDGKRGSMTWWIDDVMMDEGTRQKTEARSPDLERTAMQIHVMRVFDELIANRDRNLGNLLWTSDWKMWMIDHTRSFRLDNKIATPALLQRVERSMLEKMRTLTVENVDQAVGNTLTTFEIQALIRRRDALVTFFEARIAERGEGAVLYTLAR